LSLVDVFAPDGAFEEPHDLAQELAATLARIEGASAAARPRGNTAAFVHYLPRVAVSDVDGASYLVRVEVLTSAGFLDRNQKETVICQFTDIIASAAGREELRDRTWVVLTEASDDGWGFQGRAY
jgi:phenylpyruvate tautomerase PptA (4-oxalocrotonate tautomerase family)